MKMNNHQPTDGLILKDTMDHTLIAEFIKPWMKKKNVYTRIYNYTMMSGLFLAGAWLGTMFFNCLYIEIFCGKPYYSVYLV
jgi:hypothetical protein